MVYAENDAFVLGARPCAGAELTMKNASALDEAQRIIDELWRWIEKRLFLSKPKAKPMPKGTKVDKVYKALRRKGASKGKAARIAQAKTGKSLKTGRKPKKKTRKR